MEKDKSISKLFHFCLITTFLITTFLLYYTSWNGIVYLFASPHLYIIPILMAVVLWGLREGVVTLVLALLCISPLFYQKIRTGTVNENVIILCEIIILLLVSIFFVEFVKKRIQEITKSGGIETITKTTVDKEKESERIIKSISNLCKMVNASISIKGDYKFILEDVIDHFRSRCCIILLKDEKTDNFYLKYFAGDTKEAEKVFKSNLGEDMKNFIMRTSGNIIIGDVCEDIRYRSFSQALVRSILCVPMVLYGNITGLIYVDSPVKEAYNDKDCELLYLYGELFTMLIKAEQLQTRLEEVSIYDEVSSLMSVSYFHQRLNEEISRANRYNTKLMVLLISLQPIGTAEEISAFVVDDIILREIANIFLRCVRQGDILAKYKNSSFAIVLIDCNTNLAFISAKRIQKSIAEYLNSINIKEKISVNIGIGKYKPGLYNKNEFLRKLEKITEQAIQEKGNILIME
ncbi:MAG: diguanylate cyclase [bacterium]|nr:diguanylate cyclase [bacterium]